MVGIIKYTETLCKIGLRRIIQFAHLDVTGETSEFGGKAEVGKSWMKNKNRRCEIQEQ